VLKASAKVMVVVLHSRAWLCQAQARVLGLGVNLLCQAASGSTSSWAGQLTDCVLNAVARAYHILLCRIHPCRSRTCQIRPHQSRTGPARLCHSRVCAIKSNDVRLWLGASYHDCILANNQRPGESQQRAAHVRQPASTKLETVL
jgi:hypothetical protein